MVQPQSIKLLSGAIKRALRRRKPEPQIEVRGITPLDVEDVFQLWSALVTENFLDNFDSSEPLEELISFDRWGPGVSIPMLEGSPQSRPIPEEPSVAVRRYLEQLSRASKAGCLVAFAESRPCGFLTFSIQSHVLLSGCVGVLEELYVVPSLRGAGVEQALIAASVSRLRSQGAATFEARLSKKPYHRNELMRIFKALDWSEDCILLKRYE